MSNETVLSDLLSRWQLARAQGRDTPADELCRDRPELRAELARRIEAVRRGGALADAMQASNPPLTAAETAPSPPALSLPSLPGYEVVRELGRGGMGVVYEARQMSLGRTVALKVVLRGAHADTTERARFRTEAEAIARLRHSNVVQVYDVGEYKGIPYLALEYCPGGGLDRRLKGGPLAVAEAMALVEALARAVQTAHDKGVIHRDLKPANVLFGEDGSPKVADFGLARQVDAAPQTASGVVLGTPGYMAPEQADGRTKEIGPATDVFALGAILYECLTGRAPFAALRPLDVLLRTLHDDPVLPRRLRPELPRDLETICRKCLEKDPKRRYASSNELAGRLRLVQEGKPIPDRPRSWVVAAWARVKRHGVLVASSLLAALGAAALAFAAGWTSLEGAGRNEAAAKAKPSAEAPEAALARGQQFLYDGAAPLPPAFRYLVGPALSPRFNPEEGSFTVETLHTALLQIGGDPGRDCYRLTVDVRHDIAFAFSEVGLFCNYRAGSGADGVRRAAFINAVYADRGRTIKSAQGEAKASGSVQTRGHVLRGADPPPYLRSGPIASRPIEPADLLLKAPWRRLRLTVTPEGIEVVWQSLEDGQRAAYAVTAKQLTRYFAAWRPDEPVLNELLVEYGPRAALGLYVSSGAASFRRIVLEPLEAEEARP